MAYSGYTATIKNDTDSDAIVKIYGKKWSGRGSHWETIKTGQVYLTKGVSIGVGGTREKTEINIKMVFQIPETTSTCVIDPTDYELVGEYNLSELCGWNRSGLSCCSLVNRIHF